MSDRVFRGLMGLLWALALASLAVGVRSWIAEPRQWSTLTGSLQAIGGLSLVIVTLLYVRRVDAQVQATERTARAHERRARILENQEREVTASRLQYIIEESSELGVECLRHFQRIAEWTMADEEGVPLTSPLFPDSRLNNLEATGSRVGGPVAGAVADAVQSLEDADDLLRTAEIDQQHASDPDTAVIMENVKAALKSAQTACFEARSEADRQVQLLRDELKDRTDDQSERRTT